MIRIENLNVRLPGFHLENINLDLEANEFFMLMGPTGAGKTVLLEAVAGLIQAERGKVFIRGKEVTALPPEKRGVGIVYQDQALFPHLNVLENITYGLRFHHVRSEERKKRLKKLTELLAIGHLLSRLPINLSGGEKQRVALARALIVEPYVLLLDEPLSAIDPVFREEIRKTLQEVHENSGTTFLMVTHDFGEALSLADRGAIIHQGRIQQVGTIHDIFHKPASTSAAEFVGMKNLFGAEFQDFAAYVRGHRISLSQRTHAMHRHLAIRPEDITINTKPLSSSPTNTFSGVVSAVANRGFTYEVHVRTGTLTFVSLITKKALIDMGIKEGLSVLVSFDDSAVHTF